MYAAERIDQYAACEKVHECSWLRDDSANFRWPHYYAIAALQLPLDAVDGKSGGDGFPDSRPHGRGL